MPQMGSVQGSELQLVKLDIYFVWTEKWPEVGMYIANDFSWLESRLGILQEACGWAYGKEHRAHGSLLLHQTWGLKTRHPSHVDVSQFLSSATPVLAEWTIYGFWRLCLTAQTSLYTGQSSDHQSWRLKLPAAEAPWILNMTSPHEEISQW
jgi:hypothetical protein